MIKKVLYALLIVAIWVGAIYVFIVRNDFDNRERRLCYRTGGQWMKSGATAECAPLDEYSCRNNIKCRPQTQEENGEERFVRCEETAFCICLGDKEYEEERGCQYRQKEAQ